MDTQKNSTYQPTAQDLTEMVQYLNEELRPPPGGKMAEFYQQGLDAALAGRVFPYQETWSFIPAGLDGWTVGQQVHRMLEQRNGQQH
jgi:hypothetical protein